MTGELELRSDALPAQQHDTSPSGLIATALDHGAAPETLAQLLDLQLRFEANEARKAYHAAMSAFKLHAPRITKDKAVSFGNTSYRHATLANVTNTVNEALSRHGLSAGWRTETTGDGVTVTCTITHSLGHSESTSLSGAPDASGSKNSIQQIGSTVTYLQRYTLLALTGLATQDQDDDGAGADGPISAERAESISRDVAEVGGNAERFLSHFGVSRFADIRASQLQRVEAMIAAKRRHSSGGTA
jgi:hypothetical protein